MKSGPVKSVAVSAFLAFSLLLSGCGGGGGGSASESAAGGGTVSGGGSTGLTATSVTARGVAVVSGSVSGQSGTTSSSSASPFASTRGVSPTTVQATAALTVDADETGVFDQKDPTFTAVTQNGVFSFEVPVADATKEYSARLSVVAEGYAPYNKIVRIKAGKSVNVRADAATIPVIRENIDLSTLNASARMTSFVRVGVRKEGGALTGFSKLLSLSDLKAEADQNLSPEAGTEADYTFPVSAIPDSVKSLDISMQAFDSTDPDQLALFPGEFVGKGLEEHAGVTGGEVGLISAAFDLFDIRDQDGNPVTLTEPPADKLSASADMSGCTMVWRRNITRAQADLIKGWGDYDPGTPEFEVPIWSNDNSEGAWKFVGVGNAYNLDGSSPYFEVCIPDEWGAGYLNCDSPISFQKPQNICLYTYDQNGEPIGGITVYANSGTSYSSATVDNNGEGMLSIPDSDIAGWGFRYAGPITQWSTVDVDATPVASSREGCDYDLNITGITNPFSATIIAKAYDKDGSPAADAAVYLQSLDYGPGYRSDQRTTDANGEVRFRVRPDVPYRLTYKAAEGTVTVNGTLDGNETADTGRIATVELRDVNFAPSGYIVFERSSYKTTTSVARFTVYARDPNGDTLSIVDFKLNGSRVLKVGSDIRVVNLYSYTNGYLSAYMELNLSALESVSPLAAEEGTYSLEATVTDGQSEGVASGRLAIYRNRPPAVTGIVARDENGTNRYLGTSNLPEPGSYTFYIYGYDPDGDAFTLDVSLDGTNLTCEGTSPTVCGGVSVGEGDHILNVTATDTDGTRAGKNVRFHAGNLPPVILNAGASKELVDINRGDTFRLFAFVRDTDGRVANVEAVDQNGTRYTLQNRGGLYETAAIVPTSPGTYTFRITATDDKGATCAPYTVVLTVIAANQPPVFTKELQPQRVDVGTTLSFECEAYDPEKTLVSYQWLLDGTVVADSGNEYTATFDAAGSHLLACVATDGDGKSAESAATITVVDPNQTGTLVVHTIFANMLVGLHDPADGLALVASQRTDADGTASFPVTGDRVSFSVTLDPFMKLDSNETFELLAGRLVYDAYNNCAYGEANMSECNTTDWCALMESDTLPAWVIDAALADENVTGASLDLNGDGVISRDEFHLAVIQKFDKNGDNEVTLGEVEDYTEVSTHIFENVPVGEYTVPFSFFDEGYYEDAVERYSVSETEPLDCREEQGVTFELNITGIDRSLDDLYYADISPGYAPESTPDETNTTLVFPEVRLYSPDKDGNFDFIIKLVWNDGNTTMRLVTDKSAEELAGGYSVSFSDFKTLTPVTFISRRYENLNLFTVYKGLYLGAERYIARDYNDTTGISTETRAYLDDDRIFYAFGGNRWYSETQTYYTHQNYYSDGKLHALYNAEDYPYLDLNISFTSDADRVTFSGSDMGVIDGEWFDYEAHAYGVGSFMISLYDALPSTQKNLGDINLSRLYPADVAGFVTAIDDNDSAYRRLDVGAEEYRDATADEIIGTLFTPENAVTDAQQTLFNEIPMREVNRNYDFPSDGLSANAAESKPARKHAPLAIPFDPTILLK